MIWKFRETGLDGTAAAAPCIVMDDDWHSHCAWRDESSIRFSRFTGNDWEVLGESSLAIPSAAPELSSACLTLDDSLFPHVVFVGGGSQSS